MKIKYPLFTGIVVHFFRPLILAQTPAKRHQLRGETETAMETLVKDNCLSSFFLNALQEPSLISQRKTSTNDDEPRDETHLRRGHRTRVPKKVMYDPYQDMQNDKEIGSTPNTKKKPFLRDR